MRRPVTNIMLLVICYLWCHIQSTSGGKCAGQWAIHACAGGNGKRSDIDDLVRATNLGTDGEISETGLQEARGDERGGGGGREGDEFRGHREGDDLRSELSEGRQLLEDKQLLDIVNRGHPPRSPTPLESALSRLRSLLRTTELDVDRREEEEKPEQWQEEELPRHRSTDRNSRYNIKDSLTMLRRILDDIEGRFDSQPVSNSERKTRGYADDVGNDSYSLQKRSADQ
uniref:EEP-2 n=1 Tax=Eisenia fetida TaxID=6396 RepID=Q39713_EISFE|nr:EEP-2 precursor [Eisenia fetida]prf//2208460A GGNG-peptide [Eisenia fetida]